MMIIVDPENWTMCSDSRSVIQNYKQVQKWNMSFKLNGKLS